MKHKKFRKILSYVLCAFAIVALVLLTAFFSVRNNRAQQIVPVPQPHLFFAKSSSKAPSMDYAGQVGWLTVSGTDIDDPIMQAENNDFFLRRSESGQDDIWGCYFMDFECTTDSQNLIVYGHSLEDDANAARFSQLKRYEDAAFAQKNNTIQLYYDNRWVTFDVFSAGYADADSDRLAIIANPAVDTFTGIVDAAQKRSMVNFDIEVPLDSRLLTLCTCTADSDIRFVVTAVQQL